MRHSFVGLAMLLTASVASAETNFGIRTVGGGPEPARTFAAPRFTLGSFSLSSAAGLGSQYGRVTSTLRSPAHNRRVGGVANSWHISGRAIDIARRPGVSHAQIAASFRSAGYRLIESLDEGDHSHFAFASGSGSSPGAVAVAQPAIAARFMAKVPTVSEPVVEPTKFRVVVAGNSHAR